MIELPSSLSDTCDVSEEEEVAVWGVLEGARSIVLMIVSYKVSKNK